MADHNNYSQSSIFPHIEQMWIKLVEKTILLRREILIFIIHILMKSKDYAI